MNKVIETQLYKLLKKRELKDNFEANELSSVVNRIISDSFPVLQQVSRNFPLYTLHDPDHGYRVAENIYKLLSENTISSLNSVEISILIYAAYFHDIGMASSQDEFYKWIDSGEYHNFIGANDKWSREIHRIDMMERHREYEERENSKSSKNKTKTPSIELRRLQDIIYTEYLRINHAERGAKYVTDHFGTNGKLDTKIQIGQVNYAEYVTLVCKSHWEDTNSLKNDIYRRDLHIGVSPVNIQFCCILLRLADLIDLDPDRTPKVLKEFIFNDLYKTDSLSDQINNTIKFSAEEWAKHRAVLGYKVSPNEIRIEAKCTHPAIQKGLIEWCNYINSERINCRLISQDNKKDITEKYHLDLVNDILPDYIKSDGSYIYADLKFSLDYDRIVNLLMGSELWGDENVVFRELLQNSIDACNHRKAICEKQKIEYTPEIVFNSNYDEDNHEFVISCSDNGIGMTRDIIGNYLMQIGRSYYKSTDFKNKHLGLYPISQFGLGLMSCFMATNKVRIETQHIDDKLQKHEPLLIEIDSKGKYVILRRLNENIEGTKVSLIFNRSSFRHEKMFFEEEMFLRRHKSRKGRFFHHPLFHNTSWVIEKYAIHVDIPIIIQYDHERDDQIITNNKFDFPKIDWKDCPCLSKYHKEFKFKFDYKDTSGLAGIFRFLLPLDEKGNLSFATLIDSKFKIYSNSLGELLCTTDDYDDKSLKIKIETKEEWETAEIRGIYRDKFKQKPSASESSYDDILENIESSFSWTQDGLRIDLVDVHHGNNKGNTDGTNLFREVHVPGLNSAEIDIRKDWRVSLNVQRTNFIRNESLDQFEERFNDLAAKMWLKIIETKQSFKTKKAKKEFIKQLIELSNWSLKSHLEKNLNA